MSDGAPLMAAALLLALLMDVTWGEPPAWAHPVVGMGKYLSWCGQLLPGLRPFPAFGLGALAWWAGATLTGGLAWLVQQQIGSSLHPVMAALLMAVLLKPMLAWRMLRTEVDAVETALQQSLDAGRERLSRLVSRNTALLNESEVRESAIESLAENLNDSVVAPIFWFVLLGLPGAAIYRFANTADAMWGYRGVYKGKNWEWAGKWAARADDVLSWLPARLTALLLALVAGGLSFKRLQTLRMEARKTPSPNSGWPMAAMAMALGVSLRKPGVYTLNSGGKPPQAADTVSAQKNASKVVLALVLFALLAILFIAIAHSSL
jgi:adenosylcobinamide-phosphate synthase